MTKTTPDNVRESHEGLFYATMNLPAAAKHCGMTEKEMKMTFWELYRAAMPLFVPSRNLAASILPYLDGRGRNAVA